MRTLVGGLAISLLLTLLPAPRITIENPKLLYAAAMYKTALGDTESAVRLVHRAEKAAQSEPSRSAAAPRTSGHIALLTLF